MNLTSFMRDLNAATAIYLTQDLRLMNIDVTNPSDISAGGPKIGRYQSGSGGSRAASAMAAIGTRRAKYGETKMKQETVKQIESSGAKVRHHANERRGKDGRAN